MSQSLENLATHYEDGDYSSVPTRRMWKWVLIQAGLEADGRGMQGIAKQNHHKARKRAREWLTTPSEDLQLVCELAAADYDKILAQGRSKWRK